MLRDAEAEVEELAAPASRCVAHVRVRRMKSIIRDTAAAACVSSPLRPESRPMSIGVLNDEAQNSFGRLHGDSRRARESVQEQHGGLGRITCREEGQLRAAGQAKSLPGRRAHRSRSRSGPLAARSPGLGFGRARAIERHGSADESLQGTHVDLVAFVDVDRAPDVSIEAGVEQT